MATIEFSLLKDVIESNFSTKIKNRRPINRDMSEQYNVSRSLTKSLYNNTFPGLRLAGGIAFPLISLPVYFMGLPTPVHPNEKINEILKELVKDFATKMQSIHIQCHREGTIWVWPKFDRFSGKVVWEFINDDSVTDVIRDISSGRIISTWTDEKITVATAYNELKEIRRTRNFTSEKVDVKYDGGDGISSQIKDGTARNPSGVMPVPFANNADGDEIRGVSDYERIIPDLKSYHDISLSEQEILAKFKPKMVFEVADVGAWLTNNGYDSIDDVDIASMDLILNIKEKENVTFINPERLTEGHKIALERIFLKIVESSNVPEIILGASVPGNHATSIESMNTLIKYVQDKMHQKDEPYKNLWEATLRVKLQSMMIEQPIEPIKMVWNDLDAMSDQAKADIFQKFADGVSKLMASAGCTLEMVYKLWKAQFPKATDDDFDTFKTGLKDMANHKQYASANYADKLATQGTDVQDNIDQQNIDQQNADNINK